MLCMTVQEASKILGIAERTAYKYLKEGKLERENSESSLVTILSVYKLKEVLDNGKQ